MRRPKRAAWVRRYLALIDLYLVHDQWRRRRE